MYKTYHLANIARYSKSLTTSVPIKHFNKQKIIKACMVTGTILNLEQWLVSRDKRIYNGNLLITCMYASIHIVSDLIIHEASTKLSLIEFTAYQLCGN